MATRLYANNFSTTLNGAINNVATSIIITSATGLPTITGSDYYYLTLNVGTTYEIVKVTARTGTTLTVVRAQEGTTGTAFASGSTIAMYATAASFSSALANEGVTASVTELNYISGVTSAVQTQLNTKYASGGALGTPASGSAANLTSIPMGQASGTLPIANGGTATTSVRTTPQASQWAGWDANIIINANRFATGYTSTATAAGTTTLAANANGTQVFTGTTTQTVAMPSPNNFNTGNAFTIVNLSTGVVTVQSSGGNVIQAMQSNSTLVLMTNVGIFDSTAAAWTIISYVPNASSGQTGTGSLVRSTSPTLVTPALGTPSSLVLTNATGLPYTSVTKPTTAFYAYNNAAQSVSNGVATKCTLNTELYDSGGLFDSTTNYRYQPNVAGVYTVVGAVMFTGMSAGVYTISMIYKNGAVYIESDLFAGGTGNSCNIVLGQVPMNGTTDYIEFYIYQAAGSSKSTFNGAPYTFFSGCLSERT